MEEKKKRTKRSFTEEFKKEAVELALRVGNTQACADLGIGDSVLRSWKKKYGSSDQEAPGGTQSGKKSYADLEREVRRLSKENGYLKEINKVLKKSTAIFSQDHMGGSK